MQKIINKILLVTLFFSVICLSFAGGLEEKANKIIYEKELDFKNVPLSDVLSIISKTSGITIVPDAEVGKLNVDIYFGRGQSLGEIIRALKVTHKLTSKELNNVIVLGKDLKNDVGSVSSYISGKVTSKKTGEGLEGIKVYLVGEKEKSVLSTVGGYYIIKNVEAGTYIVKAEGNKFKSSGAIVEIKGNNLTQDIALSYTDQALNEMNEGSTAEKQTANTMGKVTTEQGSDKYTEKIELKHAFATEVKAVIDSVVGKGVEVTAVEKQNMIVLKGDEGNIQTAKNLVAELDKPVKQVRITAQVLQITGNLADSLGINWGVADSATNMTTASSDLLTASGGLFGSSSGILKLATSLSSGDIISASVTMLQTTKDAEVSSKPSVVTLNGETAELVVTSEQYIGTTETTDSSGNTTTEPTYKEAGTTLKVKATVRDGGNEKDTINLEIYSELSSFLDATDGDGAEQKNKVTNKVSIPDGGTIFIGGLKRMDIIRNKTKVPFLGDIPVFGKLFQSDELTRESKDVIIQIKAEVVTQENANEETNSDGFRKASNDLPTTLFKTDKK